MSDNLVLLIVLIVFSTVFLLVDNNVLKLISKKSLPENKDDDFFEVKKNKSLTAILSSREPNKGRKKKEGTYLENGKKILKKTSFVQTQKLAIKDFHG